MTEQLIYRGHNVNQTEAGWEVLREGAVVHSTDDQIKAMAWVDAWHTSEKTGEPIAQKDTRSGPELVAAYNAQVAVWRERGGDNTFGEVKRFAKADVGRERLERITAAIAEKFPEPAPRSMASGSANSAEAPKEKEPKAAKAPKEPKAPKAKRETEGPSLSSFRLAFNTMVPEATQLGIKWARIHNSEFESKDKGARQVARLKAAIEEAKAKGGVS